jgi:sugar phosphate isomerase/epimerase
MKIGIFAKTFDGTSPETVLRATSEAGYEVAQYNMACSGLPSLPDTVPEMAVAEIKAAVAGNKIPLVALSATYNMIHPDRRQRERGHQRLAVLAAVAAELGIPLLTLCTGTRDPDDQWRHHPDNTSKTAWDDFCQSMEVAIRIAEKYDVDLGIEPELANVINSTANAKLLIEQLQSERLKIVLDPANLFEKADLRDQRLIVSTAVETLASRIAISHAKDRRPDGSFAAAGTGILDYDYFLKALKAVGFAGPLITHGLQEGEAPQVARFLRAKLAELA